MYILDNEPNLRLRLASGGKLLKRNSDPGASPEWIDVTKQATLFLFEVCECDYNLLVDDLFRFFSENRKLIRTVMAATRAGSYISFWEKLEKVKVVKVNSHTRDPNYDFENDPNPLKTIVTKLSRMKSGSPSFESYCTAGGFGYALEFMPFQSVLGFPFELHDSFTLAEIISEVLLELSFVGEPNAGVEYVKRMKRLSAESNLEMPNMRPAPAWVKKIEEPSEALRLPKFNYISPGGLLFKFWNSIERQGDGGGWVEVSSNSVNFLLEKCEFEKGAKIDDLFLAVSNNESTFAKIFARYGFSETMAVWQASRSSNIHNTYFTPLKLAINKSKNSGPAEAILLDADENVVSNDLPTIKNMLEFSKVVIEIKNELWLGEVVAAILRCLQKARF